MSQIDVLYSYLRENYKENEPIFLSDILIDGIKPASVRPQIKN